MTVVDEDACWKMTDVEKNPFPNVKLLQAEQRKEMLCRKGSDDKWLSVDHQDTAQLSMSPDEKK